MANKSCSTHRSVAVAGEHRFEVVGHSRTKGNVYIRSKPFRVGGHKWVIDYYPNGDNRVTDGAHKSIFLSLLDPGTSEEVTASFSFCLVDPASPATGKKHKATFTCKFSSSEQSWGYIKFVSAADLAASGCLKDDRLVIKCTVELTVSELVDGDGEEDDVPVPPSDLNRQFGGLLQSGLAADVTVKIGWFRRFKAHRCVLAARSPVFRALLCGSMVESRRSSIRVVDMRAGVFEAMLHFMYNDSLPESMEEVMYSDLLVAADRYAVERLKLSKTLDVDTVGATLDLAELHSCGALKASCLKYMLRDTERLKAIVKTKGFEQLNQNHPLTASEILYKVLDG